MRPSTHQPIGSQKLTSSGTNQTATIPNNTSAILVTVETNAARITIDRDGSGDPSTTTGLVVQKDNNPWHMLIGAGSTLKMCSVTGTSVMQIVYLQ